MRNEWWLELSPTREPTIRAEARLTESARRLIVGGNAARLFKINP